MLVLTRRPGQSIIINGNIRVTLINNTGGSARIGVDAPPDVSVNREEIQERIDREATNEKG